jgi:hypothetical protein
MVGWYMMQYLFSKLGGASLLNSFSLFLCSLTCFYQVTDLALFEGTRANFALVGLIALLHHRLDNTFGLRARFVHMVQSASCKTYLLQLPERMD